jgi:SH3-like domain-containing protein
VSIVYESPKPLADTTVKEFTDRFLTKLKVRPSVQPLAPASSRPGAVRVEPESRPMTVELPGETHLVLLKRSNIRSEPSTRSKVMATLRKGTIVVKVDESGDWFNVRLPSRETGWIFRQLVKEVE